MKITGNKLGKSGYNRIVRARPEKPFGRTALAIVVALGAYATHFKEIATANSVPESSVSSELTYPNPAPPHTTTESSITAGLPHSNKAPEILVGSEGLRNEVSQHRAAQVISTFENSTTEIQYDYAENIDDGRGITAGRAGFCSGTGDMLMVVEYYSDVQPGNILEVYIEPLEAINEEFVRNDYEPVGDTTGLEGLEEAWEKSAEDEAFRQAQDRVVNEQYLFPAIERAEALGIQTAAGQLVIFDTIIQHGGGEDPDGLPAILAEAEAMFPGDATEFDKLEIILDVREQHLLNAHDPETREAWKDSVSRVDALRMILGEGENPDLTGEMSWAVYGDAFFLEAVK